MSWYNKCVDGPVERLQAQRKRFHNSGVGPLFVVPSSILVLTFFGCQPGRVSESRNVAPAYSGLCMPVSGLLLPDETGGGTSFQVFAEVISSGERVFLLVPNTNDMYSISELREPSRFGTLALLADDALRLRDRAFYVGRLDTIESDGHRVESLTFSEAATLFRLLHGRRPAQSGTSG